MTKPTSPLNNLTTSALKRHLSIAKTGLTIGTNWAKGSVGGLFLNAQDKQRHKSDMIAKQSAYLVSELGKLKGSVVKVGQMLALYGEHMLPKEMVDALHTLDDNTAPLAWHVIYETIKAELGEKIDDFDIERVPIGTASLAQVHKATHKYTGKSVVLKVQYPNVAGAIDADLSLFKKLLKATNLLPQTKALDEWFDEVRQLLHREVDYQMEAQTTKRFARYLADNPNYIVPTIYDNYSTPKLICMSFEEGTNLNDPSLSQLSQTRKNRLGQLAMDIVISEIFVWGEMQTDPNFGNYLVRLDEYGNDKLVLLDFGAIKQFDEHLLTIAKGLLTAGYYQDLQKMKTAMTGYPFFDTLTDTAKTDMAKVFLQACEPFANPNLLGDSELLENHTYIWSKSSLYERVMTTAKQGMQSFEFILPPKEMMFISRKFIGAYALLCALDARTDANWLILPHIHSKSKPTLETI